MQTDLRVYSVADLADGFIYNDLEGKGLFGLSGQQTIQPECQHRAAHGK